MKNTIPTAEGFLLKNENGKYSRNEVEKAMIEFAKRHVIAALKEASKKSKKKEGQITDHKLTNSILNSYSLDNIK